MITPQTSLQTLPLEKIVLVPEKYCHFGLDQQGIERLAQDIEEKGLLVPILVWQQQPDRYVLISGYHRLASVKKLAWREIPAQVIAFCSEEEALEASIQTNAQDEFTFASRDWLSRFRIAEEVLRQIYENKARHRQKQGKKVSEKMRVDEQLARGVGLTWSYMKYRQMRKLWEILCDPKLNLPSEVTACLREQENPKIQLWLDVLKLYRAEKVPHQDWQEFLAVCQKKKMLPVHRVLKQIKKSATAPSPKKSISAPQDSCSNNSSTLTIWWQDAQGYEILQHLLKLCKENDWQVEVQKSSSKQSNLPMQEVKFIKKE